MTIAALARPEIRELHAYQAAVLADDTIRLNSNEAARAIGAPELDGLNRYPEARPEALTRLMARYYGVATDNLLTTRGSSEGIDLLIRTFCSAGQDAVLITPPTFELYEIYASVQGATTISVPLQANSNFSIDADAVLSACSEQTKIIFLCSPNNPVGTVIPPEQILRIAAARAGQSIVVVDEAYIEYSDTESLAAQVNRHENLVVLRTLSKAHALAGARCGAVVATAEIVRLLDAVLPPYALSSPVIARAMRTLSDDRLAEYRAFTQQTIAERERLSAELADCDVIRQTWPSQANYLFVRLSDTAAVKQHLDNAGIAIRTFAKDPSLKGYARITIGTVEENQRLLDALRSMN